ncbi:MAG TPA: MFS transporter [Kofleriaceae bacterium]|nr:MFS transporter [Kofleriaceae bacterium]
MTGSVRRFTLLGSLYFAQGLPFGFFVQAIPVILRSQGYSLEAIGLTSLLAAPWALKFLWAPIVDRRWWPRIGRRRSWILAMQLAGVVVLTALAATPAADSIAALMAAMIVLNLIAATQDIATDGMAVDILPPSERGFANGLQVAGYRIGMIIGGGVLLGLHDHLGNRGTFAVMAGLTVLSSVPVLGVREAAPTLSAAVTSQLPHFLHRPGAWRLVALVFIYKFGEAFASGMLRPFLVDAHLSPAEIGWMVGTIGSAAGMAGALAGGAAITRFGRRRTLIAFGLGQVASVAGYAYLALGMPSKTQLSLGCAFEHFASGTATAALFTCMMDWSRPETGGTDYTVQASAVVIAQGIAPAISGFSAETLGYAGHFTLGAALCLAAVAVVVALFPRPASEWNVASAHVRTPAPPAPGPATK